MWPTHIQYQRSTANSFEVRLGNRLQNTIYLKQNGKNAHRQWFAL